MADDDINKLYCWTIDCWTIDTFDNYNSELIALNAMKLSFEEEQNGVLGLPL